MANEKRTELRAEIVQAMGKALLGPGESSEVLGNNPSDVYMTGVLWPRATEFSVQEDDRTDGSARSDDEAEDDGIPGYRSIRPCSIGITFTFEKGSSILLSTGSTARYKPNQAAESSQLEDASELDATSDESQHESGWRKFEWERNELSYSLLIESSDTDYRRKVHTFFSKDGQSVTDEDLAIDVRYRVNGNQVTLTASLINDAEYDRADDFPIDARCLFQAEIVVEGQPEKELKILPRETISHSFDDDSRSNQLIYRAVREFAVGHGCAATWPSNGGATASRVATTWLPVAAVKSTSFDGHASLSTLREGFDPFNASTLQDDSLRDQSLAALSTLCDLYEHWITDSVEARVDEFQGDLERAARDNLEKCKKALERMRAGVALLTSNDHVWDAFTLANRAMDTQARFASKGDRAGPLKWRPFQLAFFLMVIPGIADPNDDDRNTMDLLWFPTGGGKTEAYLGLTAFTIFLNRLTKPYSRDHGGTDVLMRYTLRLLTVQQFQRAAALTMACESLRVQRIAELGDARIMLGLYVGQETTPNRFSDAKEKLEEEQRGSRPRSTPRQLLACPSCASSIPASAYEIDEGASEISIHCRSSNCDWNGTPLPITTVDEQMFNSPPSIVIGTVDKFAQLPRNEKLGRLLGSGTPVPPSLIIQDELHLISGPLGTMTGLYETAIDLLCAREGIRPKVIGSTATIGQAAAQVKALFDRDVLQFPPPAIDASDSFFAVQDDDAPDRLYLGICSAGRSPKFALQSTLGTALQTVFSERERGSWDVGVIDPYWTAVAYFNSLRELGGAIVMMLDDVPRTVAVTAKRQSASLRPLEAPPVELSSRIASSEIPSELDKLGRHLGGDAFKGEPVDTVLASNMISVGVDVPRLGLMVVNGQPKSTAEYIQATSRVGRGLPGLVIPILNFGRPRDVAHFEHFLGYHGALYRSVEATSVTPWAPRARDKALHAVLVAALRHQVPGLGGDFDARDFDAQNAVVQEVVNFIVGRAAKFGESEEKATREELERIVRVWANRAQEQRASGGKLRYWEARAFGRSAPHLMRDAENIKKTDTPSWPTPNSMREVEPSTAFVEKQFIESTRSSDD